MAVEAVDGAGVRAAAGAAPGQAGSWPSAGVAYWTVFLMILSTAFAQLDIAIVPYLADSIKTHLRITDTQLSLLIGGSFGLFYAIVGIPIAWVIDRFSRKWLLAIAISTWSLGTALCGITQSYAQFFVARFLVGAGEAVNGPATYSILSDLFPREKLPRAVATMKIGTILGPAMSLLITGILLKALLGIRPIPVPFGEIHGWQLVLVIVGLPGVLVSILMLTTMAEPARRIIRNQVAGFAERPTDLGSGVASWLSDFGLTFDYLGRHWRVFAPMFASVFVSSLGAGAMAWMPIFYKRTFHWNPADVAFLNLVPAFVLSPLGLFVGVVIAERLAARGRHDAALRTQIIARLAGLPAMFAVLMHSPWLTWALAALTTFIVGVAAPAQNAAFQTVTPTELRGKMTAMFLFIFNFTTYVCAPLITALITDFILKDESQIRWAIFTPAAIFGPASLLITWLGLKPYEREVMRLKALEASR